MKLFNILSITIIGTLLAVGCSSTSTVTTTDGGGTDSAKADTGTSTDTGMKTDTGTSTTDTGVDPEKVCQDCVETKCSAEVAACSASTMATADCKAIVECLVACTTADCQNKCISDSTSTPAKDFVNCVYVEKCKTECTSG
jgi:hypothetical protein